MVDYDSTGPSLHLFEARFLNSFWITCHVTSDFADSRYYRTFKGPYIFILLEARVTRSGMLVFLYLLCMLIMTLTRSKVTGLLKGGDRQPCSGVFYLLFIFNWFESSCMRLKPGSKRHFHNKCHPLMGALPPALGTRPPDTHSCPLNFSDLPPPLRSRLVVPVICCYIYYLSSSIS